MTRILAIRSAFPAYRYTQADLARAVAAFTLTGTINQARRRLLDRLYGNAGVASRHTVLPLDAYRPPSAAREESAADGNDRYIEEATDLGERALRAGLALAGVAPGDLDLLMVTSVTGVAVPSLDARLIPRLGLRPDIKRLPVFGLACVAGAAGLARLHDYLVGWPGHTAALLAVELCSLSLPRHRVSTADLVASALFGDGAAAIVATGGTAMSRMPEVVATRSEVYPGTADALGWRLGPDGFRIVLTAELSDVVERGLGGTVSGFLADRGLTVDEIGTWICHPGGPKVLDAAQRALKLPDSALALSRRSLAEAGNMSSVSVLHILELTVAESTPEPGSYTLMIGLGPGVSVELVLLRW